MVGYFFKSYSRRIPLLGSIYRNDTDQSDISDQVEEAVEEHRSQNPGETMSINQVIIATHGNTNLELNQTRLSGLGHFDEFGVYHNLRKLFNSLSPYLGNKLHINLDACSTACGDFDSRLKGLHSSLEGYGVEQLSTWGALQPMRSRMFGNGFRNNSHQAGTFIIWTAF